MDNQQFKFIKGLVVKGTALTTIQAESLVKKVENLQRQLDSANSRVFSLCQDEQDAKNDLKYLREKRDSAEAEITKKDDLIKRLDALVEAQDAAKKEAFVAGLNFALYSLGIIKEGTASPEGRSHLVHAVDVLKLSIPELPRSFDIYVPISDQEAAARSQITDLRGEECRN